MKRIGDGDGRCEGDEVGAFVGVVLGFEVDGEVYR